MKRPYKKQVQTLLKGEIPLRKERCMSKKITVLGSTGSIGRQSLDVIAACGMEAVALAANSSVKLMEEQARQFRPAIAALADEKAAADLRVRLADTNIQVLGGLGGLLEAADRLALPRPVVCQPPLSLLRQEALDELLPLCAREEIAVIPYQIYQGGLLTGKYRRGSAPPEGSRASEKPGWMMEMDDALYTRLEEVEARAAAEGVAMAQYALRWVLRQSGVVSAIVGVKNERQIDDALAAL